ncbi:MAG TPA: NAD(P)-dependent alcohol dehydrogenase [Gemmatimonadales bacterium]|nr:NAD(P)-dependent alcohol dehydrogenase [Gemmatimonadales bacterium]
MHSTRAYAALDPATPLGPLSVDRRDPGPGDVEIQILYCGVCHSDLHTVRAEWAGTMYPCVPGHEIVGRVTRVGREVKGFRAGDLAGVGCMVDSYRTCAACRSGLEQFCDNDGVIWTYNSEDRKLPGHRTYGGYSGRIVVDEAFCLHLSADVNLAAAAPLLCAGITTYSPLRHWGAGAGKKIGIVGMGGLGHMGLKLSHALGAHTVLFTTSPGKAEDAKRLGADEVVISRDAAQMRRHSTSFDMILNTVSVSHDLEDYTRLLRRDGSLVLVGAPEQPHTAARFGTLISRRRSIAGSLIGGIRETQEMLDFCAEHGIVSEVEVIPIQYINEAYERMLRSDVKYRFVIDMASLSAPPA